MDDVSAVTEMIKRLPDDHRQRLIDLIWLLSQVDAQQRGAAIERLEPLLDGRCRDEPAFVELLDEASEDLRKALCEKGEKAQR